jgi:hypothetical protein
LDHPTPEIDAFLESDTRKALNEKNRPLMDEGRPKGHFIVDDPWARETYRSIELRACAIESLQHYGIILLNEYMARCSTAEVGRGKTLWRKSPSKYQIRPRCGLSQFKAACRRGARALA